MFGGYPWYHRDELINANTYPWSISLDERLKVLSPDLINQMRSHEYVQGRYSDTLSECPILAGESNNDMRLRQMSYLNFTWFMQNLLERKDRMSMTSGLEVMVLFCDHNLVEYIFNAPWDMKNLGGQEKGLLRVALKNILPDAILNRKKSPYPKTHNPSYDAAVKLILLQILNDPSNRIKDFINVKVVKDLITGKSDMQKPWFGQLMAGPQMLAYLIQVELWLRKYKVSVV